MASVLPYVQPRSSVVRVASVAAGLAASAGACGPDRAAPAPTPVVDAGHQRSRAVTARAPGGALLLEVRDGAGRCTVTGEVSMTVDVLDQITTGTRDGAPVLAIGPGDPSREVTSVDGARQARVIRAAGRVDLLDPIGVAMARISIGPDPGRARIVDAGRSPVAELARGDAQVTATDAAGAIFAEITGTADLELAALLIAPGVPADLRALLACEHLLAPAVPDPTP